MAVDGSPQMNENRLNMHKENLSDRTHMEACRVVLRCLFIAPTPLEVTT